MDLDVLLADFHTSFVCQPLEDGITLVALKLNHFSMLGIINDSAITGCVDTKVRHLFDMRRSEYINSASHNPGKHTKLLLQVREPSFEDRFFCVFSFLWFGGQARNSGQGLASISLWR